MKCEKKEYKNIIKEDQINKHKRWLITLLAAFWVVAFWRGAWMLMDKFIFPKNDLLSALVSIIWWIIIILILNYTFEDLF